MASPLIQSFNNVLSTTVGYPDSMKALYGPYPKVQVLYYDPELEEYYLANMNLTRVEFTGDAVNIDHGGPSTGLVKLT